MPDNLILCFEIVAAALYIIAAFASFAKRHNISKFLWYFAVVFNAIIVANNWVINGYVPFVSMYQVLTFLALVFAPVYYYMKYMHQGYWMFGYFGIASGIFMIGVCFMGGGGVWHFPPALQSVWFIPHIMAYMLAYSLVTVAFIVTVVSFFCNKEMRVKSEKGSYNLIVTAFPFMTMGMLFGAIWANDIWGEFWSFDAKENWSLVTWLMATLYLHFRRDIKLKKYANIFIALTFVGVIITMLFVNMMGGSSQHTYSM